MQETLLNENYQRNREKVNFIFSFSPTPFLQKILRKQKGPGTGYQPLFGQENMFRKIPFLVISPLGNFDDLIQSGFSVIPNIIFANLCNPIHNVIIIPVSSDPVNLQTVGRKRRKRKK